MIVVVWKQCSKYPTDPFIQPSELKPDLEVAGMFNGVSIKKNEIQV